MKRRGYVKLKKGIRLDFEKVDKIYKAMDASLRNLTIKVTGPELFAACYFIMRTLEQHGEQKVVTKEEVR